MVRCVSAAGAGRYLGLSGLRRSRGGSCPLDKAVDSGAGGIVDAVEVNRKTQCVVLAASDDVPTDLRRLQVIREMQDEVHRREKRYGGSRLHEAAGC